MSYPAWDRKTLKSILGFLTVVSFIFPLYYLINWIEIFPNGDTLVPQEKIDLMTKRFFNSFPDVKSIARFVLVSLIVTVNLSILWLNTFKRRGPRPPYIALGSAILLLIFIFITLKLKTE